jgi:Carboxypeptidase regulatory-like domain/TonB dependent receptor/TonB-dependent Receptor Plug Domain
MTHFNTAMNKLLAPLISALAVASLLLAVPAHAAQTGELQGYIVDDSGLPVSGARVILTSPQMIGGEKTQISDAEGRFRFAELEPGDYTVTISHASFRGFSEENIAVAIGARVIRDYLLEPAQEVATEGDEVIRVVATAPMVDVTRTTQGKSIRPEFTDRTRTTRDYQGVALFTPGTIDGAGASGNASIHGGTPASNLYLLDGLNITDPATSTFSTNFNFDAIGELQVLTGGLDAEYGSTTGGVYNIVTRSGGDEFTVDASIYWQPKELQLLDPGEVNDESSVTANLSIGGPIIRKKLWFFVSGQYVDSRSQTQLPAGQDSIFPDVESIPPYSFNAFYGLAKLKWAVTPWQKLSVMLQGDPTWIANTTQDPSTHPDAEEQRFQGGAKMIGTSETTLSENLFWKTQLGYASDRIHAFPQSNDLDTPAHTNVETGTATVNSSSEDDDRRYRLQLQSDLSYFLEGFLGDHEFKGGVQGSLVWSERVLSATGGRSYSDNGIAQSGSSISGVGDPYQVTIYPDDYESLTTANSISAFVQDTWRPFRSLTIRPGLRFDSSRAYNDPDDGAEEIYNFNTLSPRVGVAWDPFGDAKTVLRGGYYMYQETGLLSVPSFVGRGWPSKTYEYNPATEKYDILVQESNADDANIYKPGMKAPIMHEFIAGVQREIMEDTAVSVDFTYRYRQNLFEDDESNVLWNEDGTQAIGYANGEANYVFSLGTPDDSMGQYIGVDIAFEKRLSDAWQFDAWYTLSRLEGTNEDRITYAMDNPKQRPYEYGYLADDVRHKARATLSYDLPFGFQVGGTAIYQSGRPYSKIFFNDFYQDYYDRRAPRGYDPKDLDDPDDDSELRLPSYFRLDARVAWRLKELTTQDIWLIADVRNLLNNRPTTGVENRNLPAGSPTAFGQPTSRDSPTQVELALRYMF